MIIPRPKATLSHKKILRPEAWISAFNMRSPSNAKITPKPLNTTHTLHASSINSPIEMNPINVQNVAPIDAVTTLGDVRTSGLR